MNKLITKITCFFGLIVCSTIVHAQITTINYLTSSLSKTLCNVFNPQATVGGVVHSSYAGGVSFNTKNGLYLATTPQSSSPGATAFVINYNFVPGNNYTIAITALGNNAIYLKTSVISDFSQFSSNGNSSCTPDNNAFLYSTAGYGQYSNLTSTSSVTYNVPQFSIPGSTVYPYLMVWSSGGQSSVSLDGLNISKIVITQIPMTSFNITPGSVNVTCGSTTPVTFAVNSGGNYTWNLGTTPNGWQLPNGTAAPATYSTGTTNTLTLTPVCGSVQTNVSATVTANGNNYNTNTSTVTNTPATVTISGNSSLCSGSANYSVSNLPCGGTVTWSVSPQGIANPSCTNCTSTTLTKTGAGGVTLTASVSSCSSISPLSTNIAVGIPDPTQLSVVSQGPNVCPNVPVSFGARYNGNCPNLLSAGITNINWNVASSPTQIVYNAGVAGCTGPDNNTGVTIKFPSQPTQYNVKISAQNACGTSAFSTPYVVQIMTTGCGGGGGGMFTISPNPTSNIVTISNFSSEAKKVDNSTLSKTFDRIRIFDLIGNLKKSISYKHKSSASINISDLNNGIYYIEITSGISTEKHQLLVQK